jgi:hypothetical protein
LKRSHASINRRLQGEHPMNPHPETYRPILSTVLFLLLGLLMIAA